MIHKMIHLKNQNNKNMEKEKSKNQHVELPNNTTKEKKITPKDLLVYAYIKNHQNEDTLEAFPPLELLHKESNASINTIRKCIQNLVAAGMLKVRVEGRRHIYSFPKVDKHFEKFSPDFLNKKDLTFIEKAQLAASQQYMFKDQETKDGIMQYSTNELSKLINLPETTVRRNLNSLINKGYVEIKEVKDEFTGLVTKQKIYHLTKLEQAIVFILKNHEDRLNDQEDRLTQQEQELKQLKEFLLQNPALKEQYKQFTESNITL